MSAIFSVAAKLLGVILTYLGLLHILTALLLGAEESGPALLQLLSGAVAWVLAFVLVFRTDTFARFVRVDANAPAPPVSVESTSVLRTGIVLVGLYVFATRITLALSIASMYVSGVRFEGVGGGLARILIEMVPVALSLLFIFGADRVVDFVMREEKAEI